MNYVSLGIKSRPLNLMFNEIDIYSPDGHRNMLVILCFDGFNM